MGIFNCCEREMDGVKQKWKENVQRNHSTAIQFIQSWDDTMFRYQFRMCREEFYELEKVIMDHKERQGYDMECHYKYASWSSGSPITLVLWLFIILRLLSGAMYK
jgi:hypothetical protein